MNLYILFENVLFLVYVIFLSLNGFFFVCKILERYDYGDERNIQCQLYDNKNSKVLLL